jgi:hypothetical protein
LKSSDETYSDYKERLSSDNSITRAKAIMDLSKEEGDFPELVEPLADDNEPFMFGEPVLTLANAYISVHGDGSHAHDGQWAHRIEAYARVFRSGGTL